MDTAANTAADDQLVRDHLDRYTDPQRLADHLRASHGKQTTDTDLPALTAAHKAGHPIQEGTPA